MARKYYLHKSKGVIFLADEFQIGVDLKCGNDAAVLIFVDDLKKNRTEKFSCKCLAEASVLEESTRVLYLSNSKSAYPGKRGQANGWR